MSICYQHLLIAPDELWLKGGNRKRYYNMLVSHIRHLLKAAEIDAKISSESRRIVLAFDGECDAKIIDALVKVPGIHNIVLSQRVSLDMDHIREAVANEADEITNVPQSFKIDVHRSNKRFSMNSVELAYELGGVVLEKHPSIKVNLTKPDYVVEVRVLDEYAYVSSKRYLGVGGLPWSSSGHAISMLSGGFDSPVASYLMAKRGLRQDFIFFYAYPYVGDEVKEKIISLVKVLAQYQDGCRLHIVPFGDMQTKIAEVCDKEYSTIMFRKYMIDCANILASRVRAQAIITGDSLGQVSSQTIHNIAAVDAVTERPIFRPLVGYNKIEIIDLSKKINTHDISVLPHDDACALFAPKHPITKPYKHYWFEFHSKHDFSQELTRCLSNAAVYRFDQFGEITEEPDHSF